MNAAITQKLLSRAKIKASVETETELQLDSFVRTVTFR